MGVHSGMCSYISTKDTGMHGVISTDYVMVNAVVLGITNAYDKYGRYKPNWGIGTDAAGKEQKGICYYDTLIQGS